MKKIVGLLSLFLLVSCTTNYYYVTLSEDTSLYHDRNAVDSPELIIPANTQVYINRKGTTYRQIKYGDHKGWAIDPNYVRATKTSRSNTNTSSGNSYKNSSASSSKTVHVKGYTRKDGTYVRPYTRSAPRRK